jgi:hypothetical protein
MRIMEVNVYKFNELSDKAKNRALDKMRECNDFDFESECVIDDAKELAKILGINIDKIYYSGFSSQGDGACFMGTYSHNPEALQKIKEYAPNETRLHDIATLLDLTKGITASISHSGRYYHSGCMQIECDVENDSEVKLTNEDEILKDALTSFADWIYRKLENAYDHTNSDEYLTECIEINDYEFTEEGKLI